VISIGDGFIGFTFDLTKVDAAVEGQTANFGDAGPRSTPWSAV
jgi:hypothetical protein